MLSHSVTNKKVKVCRLNVVKHFKLNPEITGEAEKSILKIPGTLLKNQWHDSEENDIEKLLHHVRILEDFSVQWKPNMKQCLETFMWLKCKLARSDRLINLLEAEDEHDESTDAQTPTKWAKMFAAFGGVKALLRLMMGHSLLPASSAVKQETDSVLKLKGIALELLHTLCVENEDISIELANRNDVIHCLFNLLQYVSTCVCACKMIECLLLSRKTPLDLSEIQTFSELVYGFEDIHLANFCKILAITLSDLDMYKHKSSLFAQMKQKKTQNFYMRDINQDAILNIPNITKRISEIACAKPYIPYFPCIVSETEQWMQWIDNQVQEEIINKQDSTFVSGISQWSPSNDITESGAAIKITTELSFRADAVCVLRLLLDGRHRRRVQKELTDLCLIPQLSDLFDHFVWRWNVEHNRIPGHNTSCECSPEVALKIQVLRLIHSFCEHSDYKHAMLSWSEYSELKELEEGNKIPNPSPSCLEKSKMCIGSRGLLTKIVEVMKRETSGSTFRFWLSRAIESYLRGSFTSADQDFLIRRGLLEHVVGNLVTSNIRQKEVLQSSFDLLGELIKFNQRAFYHLERILNTEAKQKKLLSLMNGSLVDSNMFVRSLILSQEHFLRTGDDDIKCYALKQCFLLKHVTDIRQRVRYLQKLISLITVDSLTQENVSCLNTALVILMFAHKSNEMTKYLEILNKDDDECPIAVVHRLSYIQNLYELLMFWQEHYLQKDQDCIVLEKSSRISFQEWQEIVVLLMSADSTNPNSLLHYKFPTSLERAY